MVNKFGEKILVWLILAVSILAIRGLIIYLYKKRKKVFYKDNFVIGVNTISWISLVILLVFAFIVALGVAIREFFTSISIIAAAIAILSKDYFSNAINGMILMFNNQVSIGDYVKISDQKGKIINITLMNVHLMNEEGDLVLVPNAVFLNTQIVNFTKGDTRKAQLELEMEPSMLKDMKLVDEIFRKALTGFEEYVQPGTFRIRIARVSTESVTIKLSVNLIESDWERERQIRRKWLNAWVELLPR
jgi:small-conductance mechanosensitive channel